MHIPIAEAMRLTVERGLPSRPQDAAQPAATAGHDAGRLELRADHGTEEGNDHGKAHAQCTMRKAQGSTQARAGAARVRRCALSHCALGIAVPRASPPSSPAGYGNQPKPGTPASKLPPQFKEVTFKQRLNEQLPLDATFKDETRRAR